MPTTLDHHATVSRARESGGNKLPPDDAKHTGRDERLSPASEFVRHARRELVMTQAAFAQALGITRKTVLRYENGSPVPERSLIAIRALLDTARRNAGRTTARH